MNFCHKVEVHHLDVTENRDLVIVVGFKMSVSCQYEMQCCSRTDPVRYFCAEIEKYQNPCTIEW